MDPCPICEEGDPEKTYEVHFCPKCNKTEPDEMGSDGKYYCGGCTGDNGYYEVEMKTKTYCREHVPSALFCSGCNRIDQVETLRQCALCSLYYCHLFVAHTRCSRCNKPRVICKCMPFASKQRMHVCILCMDEMISERLECQGLVKSANKVTD